MSAKELEQVKRLSFEIYDALVRRSATAGFILADIKLEFGRAPSGDILLGDSIGPDEFRMWPAESYAPGKSQVSYDKQPIRDWLTSHGYKAELDAARKSGRAVPRPPSLPDWLVEETAKRYATVYETFSGKKF